MTVFLSGGAKNGKSTLAQTVTKTLAKGGAMYYVATMIPHDSEDDARIARHLQERDGWGFATLECGKQVKKVIVDGNIQGAFLFDSVTAVLANEMFPGPEPDLSAPVRVKEDLLALAEHCDNIVFVSDFLYADAGRYDELTEAYRKGLADIDRALAARCDCVVELCGGNIIVHKGVLPV